MVVLANNRFTAFKGFILFYLCSMSKIWGLIPARFASSRFPGKPLVDIRGMTMLERVYRQCEKAELLHKVVVATDDDRIANAVRQFGGEVVLTSDQHPTGTDRLAEAARLLGIPSNDIVLNIQGDEPFIDPRQINDLAKLMLETGTAIGTLIRKIETEEELFGWKEAKVVFNSNHQALYFSRSPIPYLKGLPQELWMQQHDFYLHIGLYAYQAVVLQEICEMQPTPVELAESLEMLRWMDRFSLHVAISPYSSFSIDNPEDVAGAEAWLDSHQPLNQ